MCVRERKETLQDPWVSPLSVRVCFGLTWQFAWGLLQNLRALYYESNQAFVFSLSAHSEAQNGRRHDLVLVINGTLQSYIINLES